MGYSMDLAPVKSHYAAKLTEHGKSPLGVDWNSYEAQYMRFRQLAKLIDETGSVNDWGCGYGAFQKFCPGEYIGYDIVPHEGTAFVLSDVPTMKADYTVASGLFNVKMDASVMSWHAYVLESIKTMDEMSRKGFAFNCLSLYSNRKEGRLYYGDPIGLFHYCRRFSNKVALLHDYSDWDFTVMVRKC